MESSSGVKILGIPANALKTVNWNGFMILCALESPEDLNRHPPLEPVLATSRDGVQINGSWLGRLWAGATFN